MRVVGAGLLVVTLVPLMLSAGDNSGWNTPLGLDAYMPIPEDNQLTPEKVALGRRLFDDPILSRDQTVACATCHKPEYSFTDEKPVAEGVFGRKGNRRVPTLINRGYGKSFFWDGRIPTLEEQVLQPIQNPKEMDMTLEETVERVKDEGSYAQNFVDVFGREINEEDVARALASYVRTIRSGNSPYDRYLNGDSNALSPEARRGLEIFRGKGNCTACHLGPNFTDEGFHNTGISWTDGQFKDDGRFLATDEESDKGAFKAPTLRDVARRAPYMHDGSLQTLEDVLEFYDRGGRANPYADEELLPLELSADEKRELVIFLESLNGGLREGMGR